MRESFSAMMALILILGNILPGMRSASLQTVSADASPLLTASALTLPPAGPGVAGQPLPTPLPPHDLPPEVEQAHVRQAAQAVLDKYAEYYGPRYEMTVTDVAVEGEWAYAVAQMEADSEESLHLLAHRGTGGTWQTLMPGSDGLYLQWVDAVPESLVPVDEKSQLRTQAAEADALRQQPQATPVVPPAGTLMPPGEEEPSEPVESILGPMRPTLTPVTSLPGYSSPVHATGATLSEQFQSVVIAVLPRGSDSGEIGILEGPHGEPPIGPSSISVANDGAVLILDSLNHRIIELSEDGVIQREMTFGNENWGADVATDAAGTPYVLDIRDNKLLLFRADLLQPLRLSLPLSDGFQATRLGIGTGNQIEIEGWQVSAEGGLPQGAVVAFTQASLESFEPGMAATLHPGTQSTLQGLLNVRLVRRGERSGEVVVTDEAGASLLSTLIETQTPLVAITLVGYDDCGNSYLYLLTSIPNDAGLLLYGSRLDKYSPDGELLASVPLPMNMYTSPERPLVVARDGSVYQLLPEKECTRIIRWQTIPVPQLLTQLPQAWAPEITTFPRLSTNTASEQEQAGITALALDPITRDQIMATAQEYANHSWTVGSSNYSARTCSNGCPVGPAAWPVGTQVTGVAYKWGGWDTVSGFDWKLSQGYLAGDVTGMACVGNCATGVDCSGFVQQTWQIVDDKHNVTQLMSDDYSEYIEWSQLQRGDALGQRGSHITLYSNRDAQGHLAIYESVYGAPHKVRYYVDTWGYLNGYEARRRHDVSDGGGCNPENPAELWEHANCSGAGLLFPGEGWWNLTDYDFNDIASSIGIQSGWSVKLWLDTDRQPSNCYKCLTSSDSNFEGDYFDGGCSASLNDQASSIEVFHNTSCAPPCNPPSAPTLSSPSNDAKLYPEDDLVFNWSGNASEYQAHWWGGPGGDHYSDWMSSTSWNVGQQWESPNRYYWQVRGRNGSGCEGSWSSTWEFMIGPRAPSSLNTSVASCSQVNLSWQDNSSTESDYHIERSPNGSSWQQIVTVSGTSYQDTGLSSSTTYYYRVRAHRHNDDTYSKYSNTANATTSSCPAPDPPTLVSPANGASLPHDTDITLDWNSSSGATEYYVHLWGGPSIDINSGWIGNTDWHIGQQWPGTYQWQVRARNQYGESSWSSTWTFTVTPASIDDAEFIGQSPSPTVQAGQQFSIYFEVRNTGNTTWRDSDGYGLENINDQPLGAWPRQEIGGDVPPEATKRWDIPMTAPSESGVYRTQWMLNHWGETFGPNMFIDVTVVSAPDPPTLVSPANGASLPHDADVTLDWNISSGATEYYAHLWGGPSIDINSGWIGSTDWHIGQQWPGTYQWQVRARNQYGESSWSNTWTFTVQDPPTVGPLVYDSHTVDDDTSGESNGNGDGVVNCAESIELYIDLYNQGNGTATDVNAAISTSDPYVTWLYNTTSSYPDIPSGGMGTNSNDFDFAVDPSTPDGHVVQFDLNITASNGGPWSDSFDVPVACPLPDLHPYAPSGYPYPVVPSSVQGTQDVNTLIAGQSTYFDWHFINSGNATASGDFHVELWVGDTRYMRYPYSNYGAGWSGGFDDWMEVITTPGWHNVRLVTDPDDTIAESDEANNIWEQQFYWASTAPYSDDAENGTNDWTATGLWHQVDQHTSPYPESHSWSHSWWYGQDGSSDYDTGSANSGQLTSPAIYVPSAGYYLSFWSWYETETHAASWDTRWVQISVDDGPFENVLQLAGDPMQEWVPSPAIDLSPYAGSVIQFRLAFDTIDDTHNNYRGWYVDDFSISTTPPPTCSDSHEPNNWIGEATSISYGGSLDAQICPQGDLDFYTFSGMTGERVIIDLDAEASGSYLDSYIYLLDSDGTTYLTESDDAYGSLDSHLVYDLPHDGTYYVKVRDYGHPNVGGPDYFYTINLLTDNIAPTAEIASPAHDTWLDPNQQAITTNVSDDETGIRNVVFYWHDADWSNPDWVVLDDDWNPDDGWTYELDTSGISEQPQDCAVYIYAYDWAGNYTGYGSYHLGIDRTAPSSAVDPLDPVQSSTSFGVTWSGDDNLSGIADYDVQYKDGASGIWTDWLIGTDSTLASFTGQDDHIYCFQSRSRDQAGNAEGYPGGDGDTCTCTSTPLPPTAAFSATLLSGTLPLTVAFTDLSSGMVVNWLWSFGDGTTSTLENPTHTYTAMGIYTVTLMVSNVAGSDTVTRPHYITVSPAPLEADFSAWPTSGAVPLTTAFANASTGDYTASLWDFGDSVTSTLHSPTHTYTAVGVYTVTLTVSGPGGRDTGVKAGHITVSAHAPEEYSVYLPLIVRSR